MDKLSFHIELQRKQMEQLASQHNQNLLHPEIIKASQALDELINTAMKQQIQ